MKNIMRNKEVKLFAVIFAVFIASMMLFATSNNNNKKYAFNKRFCQKFKDIDKAKRERIQMEGSK